MFPLIDRKGSPRKLQRKQRPRSQPRLEGLEGRALLSQAGDLLSNGDFSLGNTGFTSQYTDWSIDHYNAGWYGVCHNPSLDFDPLFSNFGDHTTGTGLMFGANGPVTPNVVAWQETVNVSKATDYVFSGWASSMGHLGDHIDPSPASLRFLINGVLIGSDFTTPAQNGQWAQFSVPWNSGTSDVATLQIVDTNIDPVGNDFTLDDLSFAPPNVVITGPASGAIFAVGTPVNFTGTFTDPGNLPPHTATWQFDTDPPVAASGVTEPSNGNPGSVSLSNYTFSKPGVYDVTLTIKDNVEAVVGTAKSMIVVYDPSAGFITGGGWINSPGGAYIADPTLAGKASFGFVSQYKKGATVPTGETEFQFQVADLNFHSTSYDWLVVSGPQAQYKGSGTINGAGNYGFLLTAVDGQAKGGDGIDKFRIKIWDKTSSSDGSSGVIYDNGSQQPIGGGSIVLHT